MNVIVIVADTWRFDYLGCYGNEWIKTPNIDQLAAESTVFENAYAEGCPTVPTRRALLTGRYTLPYRGWGPLLPEDKTLGDILWSKSVWTALVTDTGPMHMPGYGYERGFDFTQYFRGQQFDYFYRNDPCTLDPAKFHKPAFDPKQPDQELPASQHAYHELMDYLPLRQKWQGEEDQYAAKVCGAAMDWLEKVDRERPFLLWLDCFDPHEPWDPPSVWDPKLKCPYDPDYEGMEIINPVPTVVDGYLTDQETHHIRMLYAEKVTMVDRWLGKVLNRLKELDVYEDSLILFLSDHGQPLGNNEHGHGIIRKCRPWPYEELSHIPFIVRYPGADPKRISSFVQTVDVAPTILDFLNISDGGELMQGHSLLPMIRGETDKVRDFAISGYFNFSWSLITDDWSYINWIDNKDVTDPVKTMSMYGFTQVEENMDVWTCTPGSIGETPDLNELYNRRTDPFQLNNLLGKEPEVEREMHEALMTFMQGLRAEK
ncbi:MAG: sulfatase [Deltaproteobacteria bacterium]|nr:sulfatase [Deltaproteobacteria bacterium]